MKNMEIPPVEKENNNEKKWAIDEIEHYLFRGAHQRIGADCSGDSRGSCARSNYGRCGEFHCCECATKAAGKNNVCPSYISHEDARKEAEIFYEKVNNLKKFHFNNDKDSSYFIDFVDQSGKYLKPDFALGIETDRGTEELVWYSPDKIKDALILITNFSKIKEDENSSKFELPNKELSEKQKEELKKFYDNNGIEIPESTQS